jgi:hypothetical protein
VYTKLVYVVNVPSNYRQVPQKGRSCYNLAVAVEKSTTGHRRTISRKVRVKAQVRPPIFLSSTFRLFFFSWEIFYCLSETFFFLISSFSHIIFDLPQNNAFVSRTLQRQVRVPTGATAGSLRRATHNAPRRRIHPRQKPPSPESRSPASGSDQHRSNYGQSFSFLAKICHQERTLCSVNLLPS